MPRLRSSLLVVSSLLVLGFVLPTTVVGQSRHGRPFHVLSAVPRAVGVHEVGLGFEYHVDLEPVPLLGTKVEGEVLKAGVISHLVGTGHVNILAEGVAYQTFDPNEAEFDSDSEIGDSALWAMMGLLPQKGRRPAAGFFFGVKVPNASDESGLGTDETDVHMGIAISHESESHDVRVNLGVSILGDPKAERAQEDLFRFGVAGRHGRRHAFTWQVHGLAFAPEDERNLEQTFAQVGYQLRRDRFRVDASAIFGVIDSDSTGVGLGATWLFGPKGERDGHE
ncbi:MAG: hypothetical protein AAF533_11385 [Acidobacteriota bacterium]